MSIYITYERTSLIRRLKDRRFRLGLASSYVAKACDISIEDLAHYGYGEKPLTQDVLLKLAALYQVSPDYFLEGVPPC